MMDEVSVDSIAKVWQPIIDQKLVVMLRDWLGFATANLGLTKMRDMGHRYIRALTTKDETGKFFTNAFMIQKDAPNVLKEYYHDQ